MQFSLKIVFVAFVFLGLFLALVRISDVPSALMFMLMIAWMLSPVLVTFGVLYWQLKRGGRRSRGRQTNR